MKDRIECRIEPGPKCVPLQTLIADKTCIPISDIEGRSIICTSVRAHYGACSHWIVSVEGTPPRGTIIFDVNRYIPGTAYLIYEDSCKKLTGKSYRIVGEFVDEFLRADEEN